MKKTQSDITVVILTLNEENNIANCIQSALGLTHEVLVIDSLSSDSTVRIAKTLGARVVSNPFLSFDQQRNFALKYAGIRTEWTFFLDADERLSLELIEEIKKLSSYSENEIITNQNIKESVVDLLKKLDYPTTKAQEIQPDDEEIIKIKVKSKKVVKKSKIVKPKKKLLIIEEDEN